MVGLGELNRLIQLHLPKKFQEGIGPSKKVRLLPQSEETVFTIPGFETYGCGECHKSDELLNQPIQFTQAHHCPWGELASIEPKPEASVRC